MEHSYADTADIQSLLEPELGITAHVYETVNSTNTLCREMQTCPHPVLIVAREQTLGRGRLDRRFDSAKDKGLYMSILFTPDNAILPAHITAAAGVAVCLAIERQTLATPKIKWVNDVYFDTLKLAGILAEGVFDTHGRLSRAIVGIGVNVRHRTFPDELSNIATSIEAAYGTAVCVNRLCADITNIFFSLVKDKAETMRLYRELSCVIGRQITVISAEGSYTAHAVDIDGEGKLTVRREDGSLHSICSGEISIRISPSKTAD